VLRVFHINIRDYHTARFEHVDFQSLQLVAELQERSDLCRICDGAPPEELGMSKTISMCLVVRAVEASEDIRKLTCLADVY